MPTHREILRALREPRVWLLAAVIGALVVSFGLLLYVAGTL